MPPTKQPIPSRNVEANGALLIEGMKKWRDDPVRFWSEFTGFKAVRWQQRAGRAVALDPLENPEKKKRFVIHSGHNIGKTAWLANLAWWWSTTRPFSIVVDTAPTFERQVCNVFWGEMKKWGNRVGNPGDFEIQKARLKWNVPGALRQLLEQRGEQPGEWMITGESASKKESIAGYHSPYGVLVLIDEASGVEDGIFEALEGAISDAKGDFRLVLTGNPTKRDGEFYRAMYSKSHDKQYWRLTQTTWDSEVADTRQWCQEMLDRYGEQSPVYRSRVLGLPPDDNPSALIPLASVLEAQTRHENDTVRGGGTRAIIGVDVARDGDDSSVIITRLGDYVSHIEEYSGLDSFQLADKVVAATRKVGGVYSTVNVDEIGYGAGVVDVLRKLQVRVSPVNVARSPSKPEYLNQRAEYYFRLRSWLMSGKAMIPDHSSLREELVAINVKFPNGKTQIEEKSIMKGRLGRSPDFADALMLTFATASLAYKWSSMSKDVGSIYRDAATGSRVSSL